MPKISIVVPVYNVELYIRECLDSLVYQSFEDIEIICVNDGSTDSSLDILEEYAAKDKRIKLINQINSGVSSARNIGIKSATSEYIMFLDGDDYYLPDACKIAYETITKENSDVGIMGYYILENDENLYKHWPTKKIKNIVQGYEVPNFIDFINIWHKIYKRSYLVDNSIFFVEGVKTAEDIVFSYQTFLLGAKCAYNPECVMVYRSGRENSSTTGNKDEIKCDTQALEHLFNMPFFKSQNPDVQLKIVDKFADIVSYVYSFSVQESDKNYCKNLVKCFLKLLETYYDKNNLSSLSGYKKCLDQISDEEIFKLSKLFSVKNSADKTHKVVNIFGLKLKFKINYVDRVYRKLSRYYKKHISRIKNKVKNGEKIRVAFYVNDSKWKCQPLFNLLKENPHYEPFVLVGKNDVSYEHAEFQSKQDIIDIYNSFKAKGMDAFLAYDFDNDCIIPFDEFNPDIVFYSRQYCLHPSLDVSKIGKKFLTCYVPYFVSNSPASIEAGYSFHNWLWRYYVINDDLVKEYSKVMANKGKNLQVSGYPEFDLFLEDNNENKDYVIYAPHWSLGNTPLKYATFDWSGKYMLDFAKKHPEIKWVFKPHPILKGRILELELMTQEEADAYWSEWEKIGIEYEGPYYLDLFKKSRAMVTDCGSFLAEYMPTKNPVILLRSCNATPYNFLAQKVTKYYYHVNNTKELEAKLEEVLLQNRDPWKERRLMMLNNLKFVTNASKNIVEDLNKEFGIKCEKL